MSLQKHIDEAVGTVIGTVLGFAKAWDLSQFADELHTVKLAAIGATTGFAVTTLWKWIARKLSRK